MHKLNELRERLRAQAETREVKFHDRYVGTNIDRPGSLPTDGEGDGWVDPDSTAKGRSMREAREQAKAEREKAVKKQDPMECVKRALGGSS